MKTLSLHLKSGARTPARRLAAMTLVEMMVAMSIFSVVGIALVYTQSFGMRYNQLVESKLGASDVARRAFDKLTGDIRSAKMWRVGNGTLTSFTPIPNGTSQQGTALQIHSTTDTNSYVRYYFDAGNNRLCRMQSGLSRFQVVAPFLTNRMFFRAEDYLGNLKTDLSYKYVIRCVLEFYQYQYPLTRVGPDCLYDSYKLEFRVTSHCPDGV